MELILRVFYRSMICRNYTTVANPY